MNTEYRCCSPRPSRLKLPHNNPVFVAEREWGAMPVGVRTGCHEGDQNILTWVIATQARCRTRGSRVRQHSGWAIPNLPVVTRAPIVACGNGFVMRRRAIAFLCHVVSLFGYPAAPSVRRRRLEGVHVGRRAGLWSVDLYTGVAVGVVVCTCANDLHVVHVDDRIHARSD